MPTFKRFKFKPINTKLKSVVHHSQYIRTENKPVKASEFEVTTAPAATQA